MSNLLRKTGHPFFLGPDEHDLPAYYRRLNRFAFILMVVVFVVNEFLIRPNLSVYKKAPESFWSFIALVLNSEIPAAQTMQFIAAIALYAVCLGINVFMLPKWGPRATSVGMRSGLPTNAEYETAFFRISNPIEKFAFMVWNSILVPVSFFLASFLPCMFVNLIRSLS